MNLKRYKEIIISTFIILIISTALGIKYFNKYKKIEKSANNDIKKEQIVEEKQETDEDWKEQFDKRVFGRNENIFLKDFENYQPSSSAIKISQNEAEKIADIGFAEAETIGEAGEKENQTIRIEDVVANNFFTMDHMLRSKIYSNIKRKCYVFIRENDMGCGAMVYVDVTTGLIIGGQCFGD